MNEKAFPQQLGISRAYNSGEYIVRPLVKYVKPMKTRVERESITLRLEGP